MSVFPFAVAVATIAPSDSLAQSPPRTSLVRPNRLRLNSEAIETLVERVMPAVVQVLATGYRPQSADQEGQAASVFRLQQTLGSGVVVDAGGYVLTNAHVVQGAERVQLALSRLGQPIAGDRVAGAVSRMVPARVIGLSDELDLALLQVEAQGLTALPLADYGALRQGELVFAFGSPDALRNSVSMGVVSAVAQEAEPGSSIVWIQTDAAVNPGNSGGPLVNADGELVGLNTFIRSMSGGSEGLGFALPSAVIALAYPQLRDYGHLHRARLGIMAERVTPQLHQGLQLAADTGVIVSDLTPNGPAAKAGIHIGDVITAVNGLALDEWSLSRFNQLLLTLTDGQPVPLTLRRGPEVMAFTVVAAVPTHQCERDAPIDLRANLVERLAFIGAAVDESMAATLPGIRAPIGVVVVVRVETPHQPELSLRRGDVIHALNGVWMPTPAALRDALARIGPGEPMVLQVARNGALTYLVADGD